jgi:hypothetical protein
MTQWWEIAIPTGAAAVSAIAGGWVGAWR